MSYNYYRHYWPHAGRYVQWDPIGLAGGFNTYLYPNGNPLRYVDPLGLDPVPPEPPGPTPSIKLDSAIKRGDIKTIEINSLGAIPRGWRITPRQRRPIEQKRVIVAEASARGASVAWPVATV